MGTRRRPESQPTGLPAPGGAAAVQTTRGVSPHRLSRLLEDTVPLSRRGMNVEKEPRHERRVAQSDRSIGPLLVLLLGSRRTFGCRCRLRRGGIEVSPVRAGRFDRLAIPAGR
jgi:hypothetical protein